MVAGQGDRVVAVAAAEADLGLAQMGPSCGDVCGYGVPVLLAGCLARRMTERLAKALPGSKIMVATVSAYAGGELKGLSANVT